MKTNLYFELQNVNKNDEAALTQAALQIKQLKRDEEGVFDFSSFEQDVWDVGAVVYPIYTKYETSVNKKSGYPDIMAQMRTLKKRAYADFSFKMAVAYMTVLIGTIETISPEIYENYRELVDDFRQTTGKMIAEFDLNETKELSKEEQMDGQKLALVLERAFVAKTLLREKYQELAKALQG